MTGIAFPTLISLGVLSSALGLLLLRLAWGRKQGRRGGLIAVAWCLVAAALIAWGIADRDRGVAVGLTVFVGLATSYMAALFFNASRRPSAAAEPRRPHASAAEPASGGGVDAVGIGRRVWVFLLAGPLSAIASALLSGLVHTMAVNAGAPRADGVVAALALVPIFWGALMCWMLMDRNVLRRTVVAAGSAALGASAFLLA